MPDPCPTTGERYADVSDCEYFYECQQNGSLARHKCEAVMDECTTAGFACIFDIHKNVCMYPYEGFDCNERCVDGAEGNQRGFAQKSALQTDMNEREYFGHSVDKNVKETKLARWKNITKKHERTESPKWMKSKAKSAAIVLKLFGSLIRH